MLKDIQTQFYSTIMDNAESSLSTIIKPSRFNTEECLKVYRLNIFENLRKALEVTFPGVWKLLGDECANGLSYIFVRDIKNFPNTSVLDEWGESFPDFLSSHSSTKSLPYLRDYAYFEWLKHLSYFAEDMPYLSSQILETISEEIIDNIKFVFHPSVFLLKTDFPLDSIEVIIENPNSPSINLNKKLTYAIIGRCFDEVKTQWISESYWKFFNLLKNGCALRESYEGVLDSNADFNLTEALIFLLGRNYIQSII
jgi:hypothetical protein